MSGLIKTLIWICIVTGLISCASRLTPEGGKKDITAPVLTSTDPPNSTVNYKGKKITLYFNEYVQLVDLQSQLVVSPLMEPRPMITAYKDKIEIELPDTLRDSTTYSFSFGKSIADVHESNILDGYRYVFSTGEIIDSLKVKGKVSESASAKPAKKVTVMLYNTSDLSDSLILKRKPDYFARTDDYGEFSIENIAAGSYALTALDDKNENYQYDDPATEGVAFLKELITLPPTAELALKMDNSLPSQLRVKNNIRLRKTALQINFNRPVDSLVITQPGERNYTGREFWNERRDTLQLYTKDTIQDSLIVYLVGDHGLKDTIAARMITGKPIFDAPSKGILFNVSSNPVVAGIKTDFIVSSLNPLVSFKNITVKEDSVIMEGVKSTIDSVDDRKLSISADWKPGKNYSISVLPGNIIDYYGYENDSIDWKFSMPDDRTSGELIVTVLREPQQPARESQQPDYLLQLCTSELKVIRQEKVAPGVYTFAYVQPANYILRIVKDENNNGRWDESDFSEGKQAESVTVSESFLVRASWTLEKEISLPK